MKISIVGGGPAGLYFALLMKKQNPAHEIKVVEGRIVLVGAAAADDTVSAYEGMGGQGVLPIPLVYNGWVQKLPIKWKDATDSETAKPDPLRMTRPRDSSSTKSQIDGDSVIRDLRLELVRCCQAWARAARARRKQPSDRVG
jgi:hypothetical protein